MTHDTAAPRAVALSPDEATLYVAETDARPGGPRELRAYPIRDDGALGKFVLLHEFGGPVPTVRIRTGRISSVGADQCRRERILIGYGVRKYRQRELAHVAGAFRLVGLPSSRVECGKQNRDQDGDDADDDQQLNQCEGTAVLSPMRLPIRGSRAHEMIPFRPARLPKT